MSSIAQQNMAKGSELPIGRQIRVMVVDDSLTARTVLCKIVDRDDQLVLAGTANTAEDALDLLAEIDVDVILLDLEMPGMGGLAALPEILTLAGEARVLVVSSLTAEGAEVTVSALSMGAADTVLKPQPGEFDSAYRCELAQRIRALGASTNAHVVSPLPMRSQQVRARKPGVTRVKSLAIGASTGGIHSICQFLGSLPRDFCPAIQITQHLPHSFMPIFASQIEVAASRKASIAEDGCPIVEGEILIAPGDGHMEFVKDGDIVRARITDYEVQSGCKPSVDPMFETLAKALDGAVMGVVLSGMGRDGLSGARKLVEAGGLILAECPETCAVWGMPRGVSEAGLATEIAAPDELARWIASSNLVAA